MQLAILLSALLCAQNAGAPSQKDIDEAVKKGLEYLKTAPSPGGHLKTNCDELIFLTLLHGGMSDKNPVFQKYLKATVESPLEHTYKVALKAMCLEEYDPAKYQVEIAQCAQFLVDNQCQNGQWSYGRPTDVSKFKADTSVASGGEKKKDEPPKKVINFGAERVKSVPKTWLIVTPGKTVGGAAGDNSNSQYAALGLRACHDAKVKIPESTLHQARKWWVESQFPPADGADAKAVVSGEGVRAQGWNYKKPGEGEGGQDRPPYHAMTAGAVGATVIYEYILGRDFKKDKVTKAGVEWLGKHFSVNTNYYYMYALERAGMLYDVESFGGNNWYWKGVPVLLKGQNGDGSWGSRENKEENTWDTCFAILFLKKATRGVATHGAGSKK